MLFRHIDIKISHVKITRTLVDIVRVMWQKKNIEKSREQQEWEIQELLLILSSWKSLFVSSLFQEDTIFFECYLCLFRFRQKQNLGLKRRRPMSNFSSIGLTYPLYNQNVKTESTIFLFRSFFENFMVKAIL